MRERKHIDRIVKRVASLSAVSEKLKRIQRATDTHRSEIAESALRPAQQSAPQPPQRTAHRPEWEHTTSPSSVPHASLLMREVDRLARDAKLSNKKLAERLGVHSTMLIHLRSGRNLFSAPLLGRIAQVFPVPSVDDLIVHHLRVERAAHDAAKLVLPSDDLLLERLDPQARRDLRHFVRHFARESVETGRGLYVTAADAAPLTIAVQFLAATLQDQRIAVERLPANANPQASERRTGTAAALLIVERIEFASAPVTDLIIRRSDVLKPVVLTSLAPVSEIRDRYLARICTSMLRPIALNPLLTAAVHAE